AAPADVPGPLRGGGAAGAAGGAGLRSLPFGAGRAGGAGAAQRPDRAAAAAVAAPAGEELGGAGPEGAAGGGGGPGPAPAGGDARGPARERAGLRERGLGEDAPLGGDRPGVGAVGPQGAVHDLQPAGARPADRQAGPEAEPGAEAAGGVRGAADRRLGVRAA